MTLELFECGLVMVPYCCINGVTVDKYSFRLSRRIFPRLLVPLAYKSFSTAIPVQVKKLTRRLLLTDAVDCDVSVILT